MQISQLLAELYGCSEAISQETALREAVERGLREVGATILGQNTVPYTPHGLTIVYVLAESHVVVTTWPEHHLVLLDVLLCNPTMDPTRVLDALRDVLHPTGEVRVRHIERTVWIDRIQAAEIGKSEA